jgi:predicted porin
LSNSVAGTVSDNKTYMVSALWNMNPIPLKLYAGYEHIAFDNPTNPLPVGTLIIGGYQLAVVNNAAYHNEKTLQVFWGGLKWNLTPDFDFTVAYYGYKQNSFATGAHAGCADISNSGCSGNLNAASLLLDYKLTKRFDIYGGTFWNEVTNGLANGYYARNNVATTFGARFKF